MSINKVITLDLPPPRPQAILDLVPSVSWTESFMEYVDQFFWFCVWILQVGGDVTGMGYNLLNIVVFVIGQPLLIALFALLWWKEKQRRAL